MAIGTFPTTETMNVSETRKQLSGALNRVHRRETRVVVEKSGIAVGALVSMDDLARLSSIDEDRRRLFEVMANIAKGFEGVSEDELEREVEKAVAEVKAERRAKREVQASMAS
ncbi:MAG: hypothetical protein ACR2GI_01165 [Thermomicrobiales bacterium]